MKKLVLPSLFIICATVFITWMYDKRAENRFLMEKRHIRDSICNYTEFHFISILKRNHNRVDSVLEVINLKREKEHSLPYTCKIEGRVEWDELGLYKDGYWPVLYGACVKDTNNTYTLDGVLINLYNPSKPHYIKLTSMSGGKSRGYSTDMFLKHYQVWEREEINLECERQRLGIEIR